MPGPLNSIRVLDLSRVLAGPWCTQILADLGAEVIKVERPGHGDETREWGPPWLKDQHGNPTTESAYYLGCNRGKRSLTLNLNRSEAQDLVRELARSSDIFIENFKTGGLTEKSLGYQDIRGVKPDIIYCSITGFGQTGPRSTEAGYDYLIQGMGGLMSITGNADGEPGAGPQRVGVAVSDLTTGMYAAIALLAALHHRDVSGAGQYIDLALLDTQVGWLANQAMNFLVGGKVPLRTGAQHPNLAPYQPFPTKDGFVIIAIGNDGQFRRFCKEAGAGSLEEDERFTNAAARVANRKPLIEAMEQITRLRGSQDWIAALSKNAVPCGPINNIEEVFADPQVQHRGLRIDLPHPLSGTVPSVGTPIKYSETPLEFKKAPPLLGADTDWVLKNLLGKSDAEIAALRERNVL